MLRFKQHAPKLCTYLHSADVVADMIRWQTTAAFVRLLNFAADRSGLVASHHTQNQLERGKTRACIVGEVDNVQIDHRTVG